MRSFGIITPALFLLAAMLAVFGGDGPHGRSRDLGGTRDWVAPPRPTTANPWWTRRANSGVVPDAVISIPEVPVTDFPNRSIDPWRRPDGVSVLGWWDLRGCVFGRLARVGPLEFDEVRRNRARTGDEVATYRAWLPKSEESEASPDPTDPRTVDFERFVDATRRLGEIVLRVDHRRSWRDVEALLAAIVEDGRSGAQIQFVIDGRSACCDKGLAFRVEPPRRGGESSEPRRREEVLGDLSSVRVRIDLAAAADAGTEGGPPRVRIGDESWTFPAGDPYATPESVESANRAWDAVAAALAGALSRGRPRDAPFWYGGLVDVDVDPRVPWSHVAQFAAIAFRAYAPRLWIPSRGLEVRVELIDWIPSAEAVRPGCDPHDFFDPPGVAAFVELGAGALVAVAFVLGLARSGRSRRTHRSR